MSSFVKKVEGAGGTGWAELHAAAAAKGIFARAALFRSVADYMAKTIARKDLSTEQRLQLLFSYQNRFDKLQRETGGLSSWSLVSAAEIQNSDYGALPVAAPDENSAHTT